MRKMIGATIDLKEFENLYSQEYYLIVKELIEKEEIKKLENYFQHAQTTRLKHSINVSYYSYFICKLLGFDYKSAARAGLLHDLFYYDWREEKHEENHAKYHPKEALRNAEEMIELNKIERDAILNHMCPIGGFPKFKEGYVITLVDKYCAIVETVSQTYFKIKLSFNS